MLTESVAIKRDVESVYRAFADLTTWKRVLPDVLGVEIVYDDGKHQEFLMTVSRPAGPETVRGIRFCTPSERIELVQPKPPPSFRRMVGVWTFAQKGSVTEVKAERWFDLLESTPEAIEGFKSRLGTYLRTNLNHFKAHLEAAP
ncbi:SRPBCC family protein [Sorangium sp. So ce119]|uniref:SRPBCC family protein n=1 Tax=Sorangium sp. So ce119 TaxID=3133279 RepID=UPI003F5F2EC3